MKLALYIVGVIVLAGALVVLFWLNRLFASEYVSLPTFEPDTQVIVEGDRTLDPELARAVMAEINTLRARPWLKYDGKANSPSLTLRVVKRRPDGHGASLNLTEDSLAQIKGMTSGGYAITFNPQTTPNLNQLIRRRGKRRADLP